MSDPSDAFSLVGKRIVIVEDEGITMMQLRRSLANAGLEVVATASDGQSAVEAVLRERPDLVLMDIQMPTMDGLEAAQRILAEYRVCIVLFTAFVLSEYEEKAWKIGVSGYICKPVMREILLPEIQQAFSRFHAPEWSGPVGAKKE